MLKFESAGMRFRMLLIPVEPFQRHVTNHVFGTRLQLLMGYFRAG